MEQIIQAFYNLYVPGCVEHYLVHIMREHEDFIPELDFVLELNGHVIGNIMYTKTKLIDKNETEKEILTFGPVSILPAYQRMGYGKMLMEHSFKVAIRLGYDTIVIFGSPSNYVSHGFKSCKKYNVCIENSKSSRASGRQASELRSPLTVPPVPADGQSRGDSLKCCRPFLSFKEKGGVP